MQTKKRSIGFALLSACLAALMAQAASTPARLAAQTEAGSFRPAFAPATMTANITNPYFPLAAGRRFVYAGIEDGHKTKELMTVLPRVVMIAGAPCSIVRDTVYQDGKATEETYDWYSQDASGNVWYMGEDSRTLRNDHVMSTQGSWKAGVNGAQAGVVMESQPRAGDSYRQEYYPRVAQDMARVVSTRLQKRVPYGRFTRVICTQEWSPLEAAVTAEQKCYAPGVGLILEQTLSSTTTFLTLRSIVR